MLQSREYSVMFSKHRVEALSDGIFAIAMTLLILDIKVPLGAEGPLGAALRKDAASWVSFAISFLLAGVFWMHQHRVFEIAAKWSKANLVLTFLFLAFVSTLPFSTSLWGHHLRDPLATSIYFANQCALAVVLVIQVFVIAAQKHASADAPLNDVRILLIGLALGFGVAAVLAKFSVQNAGLAAVMIIALTRAIKKRVASRPRTA